MSAPSPALAAKLRPPSRSTQYVPRPRLAERLPEVRSLRVALVSAPAGSGETTVLSDWHALTRKAGTSAAWISLDQFDNVPSRFLAHLLAAFHAGCPDAVGDEARRYFRDVCKLRLPDDQIRAPCSRSEGWITALQLTAMTVARRSQGRSPRRTAENRLA